MNKNPYYLKRQTGQNSYNNNHGNYAAYLNSYKKNHFRGRPKQNNVQINNYFENRKNSYYYNNTFFSFNNSFSNFNENKNYNYSSVFQKNRYWHKYNHNFVEEKKMSEETNNEYISEEEKMEEVLKIKVNVSDSECKELVIYKNDVISERVLEFCKDNNISEKLVEALVFKVNQSLNTLEIISNMSLNKNDFLILDKVKNNFDNNKDN